MLNIFLSSDLVMDLSEEQFVWSKALYCNYDVGTLGIIITTKQTNEGSPYIRLRF